MRIIYVILTITLLMIIVYSTVIRKMPKDRHQPYVALQTEEILHSGDTLQVITITHTGGIDTIWVGYLN